MSTNAMITVKDKHGKISIFRHWDGDPDQVLPDLNKALKLAWGLPRMEVDEFAAAIVATFKTGEGNIRICPNGQHFSVEYIYEITPDEEAGRWAVTAIDEYQEKVVFKGHIGD